MSVARRIALQFDERVYFRYRALESEVSNDPESMCIESKSQSFKFIVASMIALMHFPTFTVILSRDVYRRKLRIIWSHLQPAPCLPTACVCKMTKARGNRKQRKANFRCLLLRSVFDSDDILPSRSRVELT